MTFHRIHWFTSRDFRQPICVNSKTDISVIVNTLVNVMRNGTMCFTHELKRIIMWQKFALTISKIRIDRVETTTYKAIAGSRLLSRRVFFRKTTTFEVRAHSFVPRIKVSCVVRKECLYSVPIIKEIRVSSDLRYPSLKGTKWYLVSNKQNDPSHLFDCSSG